ncbi:MULTISPECIES: DivIVA domain-containing protein [Rhodococcus]|uniref:DivIVA domain-containing protein n=1 Tax=Rhodococcus rhodochrous TaxID=1829 RepID=A0AA46WYS3_RHORH|nr:MULTISPECIES: DivIVA domain-containing protein [Rhodococcus]MBF4477211.1 DivIVA domain-containing protein [Rhodococcus rhodochrous]MCB8912638.1 DivIVA domain-containing protein [Rhodococcus rhodochrous]MDC3727144.1 DivIVA domain-containing protein [Rhodococcus sp. Rp3]MDJ0399536.1 DivIVA domain-containing protein [Rhodococcus rhodochrous]MDO1484845.1 DivIVA domain-containing protein [Rhodococcus rhodochrous]
MLTVLLYVLVMAGVAAVLFFVASAVFGRGETLAPLPPGTTVTVLPATDVTGTDIRDLRFQQTVRGYKMSEVDWALDRLAREVDDLRVRLADAEARAEEPSVDGTGKGGGAEDVGAADVGAADVDGENVAERASSESTGESR